MISNIHEYTLDFLQKEHWLLIDCQFTQTVFTCSKLTMETPEQCVKYVQS